MGLCPWAAGSGGFPDFRISGKSCFFQLSAVIWDLRGFGIDGKCLLFLVDERSARIEPYTLFVYDVLDFDHFCVVLGYLKLLLMFTSTA